MTHDDERAAVVAEAMTWIGTPWAHMAHLKGVGVDCANLPIAAGIASLLGAVSSSVSTLSFESAFNTSMLIV